MASKERRRRPTAATNGSSAYDLAFYGDVLVAPTPEYNPPRRQRTETAPKTQKKTKTAETAKKQSRARVKVRVREQQAIAPFAICGFIAVISIAIVLLLGYVQLNSVYAETVTLQNQLSELQSESANLEALYEETFDRETLERAVAANGMLTSPTSNQTVYIDLSEPDNAVVYDSGASGVLRSIGNVLSYIVEYFR